VSNHGGNCHQPTTKTNRSTQTEKSANGEARTKPTRNCNKAVYRRQRKEEQHCDSSCFEHDGVVATMMQDYSKHKHHSEQIQSMVAIFHA
jgi:hypothetical protein